MADLATDKTHLILVNAVVEKGGRILISQRSFKETHQPGSWTIPGGKVERTEGDVWNIISYPNGNVEQNGSFRSGLYYEYDKNKVRFDEPKSGFVIKAADWKNFIKKSPDRLLLKAKDIFLMSVREQLIWQLP